MSGTDGSSSSPISGSTRGSSLREDNVGKRFLCVSGAHRLKLNRYTEWPWRAGVIRCSSHLDSSDKELQFLVEFDDQPWENREWINVYSDSYHIFLVESLLSLGSRPSTVRGSLHPLIVFRPLLDNIGFFKSKHLFRPVEFLLDSLLDFQDTSKLKAIRDWDPSISGLDTSSGNERAVRAWAELQDGQHLLTNTPSVLIGLRIKVYRAEGTTQWYTAVTTGYNDDTEEFTLIDDTVLEEHYEDPRLTQLKLIGDGVVESILKGENIGITPRRSRSAVGSLRACHHYRLATAHSSLPKRRGLSKKPQKVNPPPEKALKRGSGRRKRIHSPGKTTPVETLKEIKKIKGVEKSVPKSKPESQQLSLKVSPSLCSLVTTEKNAPVGRSSSSGKRKAVAIVRPQPQQGKEEEPTRPHIQHCSTVAKREEEEEDLKARYSLYDFHSDDSDEASSSLSSSNTSSASSKRTLLKGTSSKRQRKYQVSSKAQHPESIFLPPSKEDQKSSSAPKEEQDALEPETEKQSSSSSGGDLPKRRESSSSELRVRPSSHTEAPKEEEEQASSPLDNHGEEDHPKASLPSDAGGAVLEDDSGVSSSSSTNSQTPVSGSGGDEPSSSSSELLLRERTSQTPSSSVDHLLPLPESPQGHSSSRMSDPASDRTPPPSGDRRLLPPGNPLSAAAAAANLTALTAHYQAAALQQAGLAAHGAGLSPHLLAQYHQSLAAAGLPPDMLLKQQAYHPLHAASPNTPGALPPHHHLLGGSRNDYSILAREREIAADRERIFRERAEAEQRERERKEKEQRIERERREREERERRDRRNAETDFLKKQQAVEAVDQHFQLSMELAKKKMADAGQHWSQLPGINNDDRRKFEDCRHDAAAAAFRQQQQYINAMAANIGNSRLPSDAPSSKGLSSFKQQQHQELSAKEPPMVVFKPYETTSARYHPSNSVSPVGGHSTPSPHMSAASPPSTPFFPNNGGYPRTASSSPPRIAPPPAHSSLTRPSSLYDELPLDLGSGNKRQSESMDMPPKKAGKFDAAAAGTLYKVCEPSVLPPEPIPSVINTVINKAVVLPENLSTTTSAATSVSNSDLGGSLNLVTNNNVATGDHPSQQQPPSNTAPLSSLSSTQSNQDTNSDEDFGYVHKLKKAWIKAYSEPNTAPPTPSHPPIKSSFSNPPTPNPRGTPSPALSTHSSTKGGCTNNNNHHSKGPLNGGGSSSSPPPSSSKKNESSSSDSESSHEVVVKRRNPGKKGPGKGGRGRFKQSNGSRKSSKQQQSVTSRDNSDSNSESDKDSQDEKPKKRGRKPGLRKSGSPLEGRNHHHSPSTVPPPPISMDKKNPFQKPSIAQLKKTGESFLQDASCFEVAPKLAKCRECRWTQSQRNKKMPNIFCRFYAFRRLKFTKNGQLAVSGFCNPMRDASETDIAVWSVSGSKSKVEKDQAIKVLKHLRDDFSTIMDQERAAQSVHMASDDTVAWKRVVQGVREMCDVCDATLFNFHWACSRCGFVVCVDCYLARKEDVLRSWGENDKERDKYSWLLCTNRQGHELEKLVLTQIVAGDALGKMEDLLASISPSIKNGDGSVVHHVPNGHKEEITDEQPSAVSLPPVELKYFVPKRSSSSHHWKDVSSLQNKEVKEEENEPSTNPPHKWLCDGRVLCLDNDVESQCLDMFRQYWGSGNPVLVKHSDKLSSVSSSWEPQKLIDSFGDVKVELVESLSERSRGVYPIKKLLCGFMDPDKCIKDESGHSIYLKAKDWPPQGEEFAEAFPSRCNEFLSSLPLSSFTDRTSQLNLASSLPDVFVRPDLGPRAWFIHGTPSNPDMGTINIHVDVSDSLNVVVHSSESGSQVKEEEREEDSSLLSRPSEAVALWHVFHPRDADKIRDLLNKEFGVKDLAYDHLHEETKYLDSNLRAKLKSDYGVTPVTLFQKPGEALLIPAGSPKQVKHLKCVIALSNDFVSAESLSHSFYMVQSMRNLSESQTMGEDKLQVKNLIFHSVKDALKALSEEKS